MDRVLERLVAEAADEENRDHDLARDIQDAVLVKLVSGAPMPVRVSSLFHLRGAGAACHVAECNVPGCRGSRVVIHGDDTQLIFKHSKTEYQRGDTVATFPSSSPLGRGLAAHQEWGRRRLRKGQEPWSFWVQPDTGRPWPDEASFTRYVNAKLQGATKLETTTVRGFRTIAATELSAVPGMTAETLQGLAMGMGTSVRQWERTYAPGMRELQIKSAVTTATQQLADLRARHREEEAKLELELQADSDDEVVIVSAKRARHI